MCLLSLYSDSDSSVSRMTSLGGRAWGEVGENKEEKEDEGGKVEGRERRWRMKES